MAHRIAKFKKEIKGMSESELKARAGDLETQLFGLKMQFKTGQLPSSAAMKSIRKDLARVKTAMGAKR
jgi:large subunit ribosomal protein L29